MNDEEFDELLKDAAATYNVPPTPRREAMWEAIAAARSAAEVVPIQSGQRGVRWIPAVAAAAAVLMIGIAIGRQTRGGEETTSRVASAGTRAPSAAPTVPSANGSDSSSEPAPAAGNRASSPRRLADRAPQELADIVRQRAAIRRLGTHGVRSGSAPANSLNLNGDDADAYRLAVVEHLTRTEVLLTDFRAEARTGNPAKLDAQFASVSRELLNTTRLLLATRRGEDPVMTRLLQDLEYVLMQLSQYANDGRGADLDAINQSIERRNVLPKLRYSIPAGVSASAGT